MYTDVPVDFYMEALAQVSQPSHDFRVLFELKSKIETSDTDCVEKLLRKLDGEAVAVFARVMINPGNS